MGIEPSLEKSCIFIWRFIKTDYVQYSSFLTFKHYAQLVKKFPVYYGHEGSSPCSQQPATSPSPEPDESNLHPKLKFHFNIILSFKLRSSERSLLFRLSNQYTTYFSSPPFALYLSTYLFIASSLTIFSSSNYDLYRESRVSRKGLVSGPLSRYFFFRTQRMRTVYPAAICELLANHHALVRLVYNLVFTSTRLQHIRFQSREYDDSLSCLEQYGFASLHFIYNTNTIKKSKAVPLHTIEAHGGRGVIAPTHT
jgi:hypothetical protein